MFKVGQKVCINVDDGFTKHHGHMAVITMVIWENGACADFCVKFRSGAEWSYSSLNLRHLTLKDYIRDAQCSR